MGGGGVLVLKDVGTMNSLHWSCEVHAERYCVLVGVQGGSNAILPRLVLLHFAAIRQLIKISIFDVMAKLLCLIV